eukprot:TRINITY_DN7263_c0_g1_i3.p1 TRINITY_DN7263_c0_g1~~TRINITY_DN7263_c0_g1_i3.p1  ORF type:complete len:390 (-),score=48.41 TRINITY_DN7263_c0_g1_i3:195-1364(-)
MIDYLWWIKNRSSLLIKKFTSKKERARNKLLSYQKLLVKSQEVQPISQPIKKRIKQPNLQIKSKLASSKKPSRPISEKIQGSQLYDLWESDSKLQQNNFDSDLWDVKLMEKKHKPQKLKLDIPILEELQNPGCSYNPEETEREKMLDTIYEDEMQQQKRAAAQKLEVQMVPASQLGNDRIQQILEQVNTQENQDEENVNQEEVALPEDFFGQQQQQVNDRKTKPQRNKEKRLKMNERLRSAQETLKRQRRQIDDVKVIQFQISQEEKRTNQTTLQRLARLRQKLQQAPRLGRLKFEPMNDYILAKDEVGGGLRRLQSCSLLALDRYKSLQKRGLIEPGKRIGFHKKKKIKYMEKDAGLEKALELQAEIRKQKQLNKENKLQQAKKLTKK